jgi:hypothetical protein
MEKRIKFILGSLAVLAIAAVAAWNMSVNLNSQDNSELSDVSLANVEALAQEVNPDCPNGCLAICSTGCYCNGWYELYKEATWN